MSVEPDLFQFKDPGFVRNIEAAKLDLDELKIHSSRFREFKSNGMKNGIFKIKDSCRLDNGRIVPYSKLKNFPRVLKNIGSFIPAAGSSTRYLQPIYEQKQNANESTFKNTDWVLPRYPGSQDLFSLEDMLSLPKALYPCVLEGQSFLELKWLEQKPILGVEKTICIIPPNSSERFYSEFQKIGAHQNDILLLEQGPELSTVRLDKNGQPLEEDLSLSVAPAGHGSLLKLFPKIKKEFPTLETLFIRNIDNVIGSKEENTRITEEFLGAHVFTLGILKKIRKALADHNLPLAAQEANLLLEKFSQRVLSLDEKEFLNHIENVSENTLLLLQISLFQTPLNLCKISRLSQLFNRPLNFLGQVPNLGKDRGGTPVLVQTEDGETAVCLELPHFSDEDQSRLQNPYFATHFNPVFAAVELQKNIENYKHNENPYWIFAEKQWRGSTVYYHESILYEMIGNSAFANMVFVEVPRSIFNPHKTLGDTSGQRLKRWI